MKPHTIVCTLLSAALLAPAVMGQAPQTEELKLKLPKPMFIGTPTNIKSPNLEAVTGKSRAPFMVPDGYETAVAEAAGHVERQAAGHRRARDDHRRRERRR